jgi:hypothetical protein
MRPKALGRDDPEGAADAEREPEALEVKLDGSVLVGTHNVDDIDNIDNHKS